jgi:signal transduction histidine kinase
VWTISPKNDTLASLCSYLCQFALEFFRHSTTRCRVLMAEDIPRAPLSPEMRHHLFLAAREALNNALKHARASEVQVVMHVENGELELAVRDDGSGFSVSAAGHTERNGLRNMRARMEEIGGRFEIHTSAEGTVARLRLPVPGAKNAGAAPAPAGV